MSENKKEWKDTLLMPVTDFDMRAGLTTKEPEFRKRWEDNQIYKKALKQNEGNQKFILHDGPPYANGSIHVGHALNKVLKDIIVRYKTMNGFYTPFVPGWDTHGLPIENKMLSELKMKKDDLDKIELRKQAAEYAKKQVAGQLEQFKALNLLSDMEAKYLTLMPEFEVGQLKLFKKMILDGLVYKGLKPVYWSWSSQSALAEAEVEYEDHRSPQVIVSFVVSKGNEIVKAGEELLIMTTTPWTLIANTGVAVGENFDYSMVSANGKKYVVATVLIDSVAALAKWESFEILNTFKGSDLVGLEYTRPVMTDKTAPVVLGHHVTTDAGTGLVHMAPLFGEDDFLVGKKAGLEMIMHMNDDGTLNAEAGKYEGIFYEDANKEIGMMLEAKGQMLSFKTIKHSYPHDWRTHKPVIYRGTPQWFVSIDKIKGQILDELKNVNSYPEWGTSRIATMIEGRYDWTISRQRTWGVPITVFYDAEGNQVVNEEILDYVIALVAENGTDIWWERTTDELLPESYRGKNFTREMDIMDVWFDSGSSFIWADKQFDLKGEQVDVYLEGSDQYRGWFNSSLINSIALKGKAPYKQLVSHGFVLDGKNQKMSKSKGNVVDPQKVVSKQGADILRLWVANSEYTSDVTISDDILKQTSGLYRNFRTKLRFMIGNLHNFDESMRVELTGFHALINERFNNLQAEVKENFEGYKFSNVVKLLNVFLVEASGFYFDYAKDELYCGFEDSNERRMFQTNFYNIALYLIKILAPILPTSMEDAYDNFPLKGKKESVHLETLEAPKAKSSVQEEKYAEFFTLKDEVYKAIEEARKAKVLSRANEAYVTVNVTNEDVKALDLKTMFMVGKLDFGEKLEVRTFDSEKCQRCWNHHDKGTLNADSACARCEEVTK